MKEHNIISDDKRAITFSGPSWNDCDDDDSDYVNESFDTLVLLAAETEPLRQTTRGKTFLPPKPKAPTNKTEKLNRDKDTIEQKQNEKDEKRQTV